MNEKLRAILALYISATIESERNAAKRNAELFAERQGMTFEQALAEHQAGDASQPAPSNVFEGFDDWMEGREPGLKAREAKRRAYKVAAWRVRRSQILARYGGEEAAFAVLA